MSKHFNITKYSKREALETFHNEHSHGPKTKDFWKVDSSHDNLNMLQSLIDALFNNENPESRVYTVATVQHQCGSRLIVRCNVCHKDLSSYDPFMSHDQGKSHKKAHLSSKNEVNPNKGPLTFLPPRQPCHLFENGTLEFQLDMTTHLVVGAHMLYAEKLDNARFFTCRLCSSQFLTKGKYTRMPKVDTFDHVVSDTHIQAYLETKYRVSHLKPGTERFYEEGWKVHDKEGRMVSKIYNLSNTDIGASVKKEPTDIKPRRPTSPEAVPKITLTDVGVQTEPQYEGIREFAKDMVSLQQELCSLKSDHPWILKLNKDRDAFEMLCVFIIFMVDKLVDYAKCYDNDFLEPAYKLREKCGQLLEPLD